MILFGIAAIVIFVAAIKTGSAISPELASIEILLIVVLALLAQTVILIRIYDQNMVLLTKK
ncbi:MAG: hypothetical protein H6502_02690 [Candidatus Woesearchaeota archaeon]|nr:MAG: hypothetical protein H6502_02690 [Candidatus Woesearchaeota archaeon]